MSRLKLLLALGCVCLGPLLVSGTDAHDADAEPETAQRRRHLQAYNREALARLRFLASEQLSQSPATLTPYPQHRTGASRRRRLASAAEPYYATQCLYEPPSPTSPPSTPDSSASPPSPPPSSDATAASHRRRQALQASTSDSGTPSTPPTTSDATSTSSTTGTCYLNPAVLAHPDFPAPETPIEIMLLKSAWTAYQCSFMDRKGRCGTYRHEPYDCRWQADQGRCAVPSDYLLPRLLTYLHCQDAGDTEMTPFWDRCYQVGVVLTGGDNDWCGQSDGNLARCWWFPARNDSEADTCGPSPAGGVKDRDRYDQLVSSIRSGIWQREWFGSCPTSDLVWTIKSACNYTTPEDCAADPVCRLAPDRPAEYGMCRLRDELVWLELFGADSALFNATAQAMSECAAASSSLESCMAAGSLGPPGGPVPLDASKFGDVVDLVFIEEVTPGSAARGLRAAAVRTLVIGLGVVVGLGGLLRRGEGGWW
ncbi:hypothetical protein Agub_g9183 [Astrephomene gubernaculifera]|uniref:Uncharacterized protein n=1 Tax=Astrephomene gubernaculifera TaxID=47775 RepID=A0AAD3DVK5_9CHLO|nr:hypothetical protein Agub_g9183 [Astrephomene gubernaculifera]